jgi:S1-C subfamily serine protease
MWMNRMLFVGVAVTVGVSWLSSASASSDELELRDVINYQKQCVFRLRFVDGRYTGTGFVINTRGNMVTCAHVVDSSRDNSGKYVKQLTAENYVKISLESEKSFRDMITFKANVDTVLSSLDLAVLSIDLSKPTLSANPETNVPIKRPLFLRFSDTDSLWEGQELFACAYIDDGFKVARPVIARGVLSTIRERCFDPRLGSKVDILQLDLNISKGNSGGPVFLPNNGRVVGMIDWGIFRDSKWQTGYAVALSTNQIVEKLQELKIPLDFK